MNNINLTDEGSSLIDYYNNNTIFITVQYNYLINEPEKKDDSTIVYGIDFSGYLTIGFQKDVEDLGFVAGDVVSIIYKFDAEDVSYKLQINEDSDRFTDNSSYEFCEDNELTKAFGIIDWTQGGNTQPVYAITEMSDMNLASHNYINGYVLKN